ncbi:DUF4190 domain-containing protein [Saxibacter everestensis]|uniref:DUF4190 domain-containing protein n=1 Tax=Saxibacter everestensis TaxID=2909229 RepID=A0ABY8QWV2_9MICO|nr:DUF4190 domain-containing protein [Brevibacteriaceae bacterium ZFBP1038]
MTTDPSAPNNDSQQSNQGQYGASYNAGGYGAPAPAKTNVLAIIALILGIVVPIGGIICGPIALKQIKRTGENGAGLAKAGLIIGIILTLVTIVSWIIVGVMAANAPELATY